ncbi:MAG: permease [Actinophytocola sp.]|nr:permease [Actinophytocola sp.]
MAAPDDLEARVAALETQVRELADRVRTSEQDAAAARVLAGGADRDVTEIRGEIRDFRQQMNNGFTEARGKLDAAAVGQQQIVGLLNTLIGQQDDQ